MQNRTPQKAEQVYESLRRSNKMLEKETGPPNVEKDICAEF